MVRPAYNILELAASTGMYDIPIDFIQQYAQMTSYRIALKENILRVSFGETAQNDQIIQDAAARLEEMQDSEELGGGPLLKINGPISVPVAFVLAHKLAHLYGAIACFDPKLGKYVVCITHNPEYKLGDLIK
ncbi:CRISPR-associated protein Csx3 [Anabaena sp. CS-542/02]|uniref:CRISPR-associated protein Csx3 n=1 Tax=Anabaena sp. CS-542/02 TaxID=3021719 RepID=UPI00232EC4BB|nr:CRISPR-associated protein Csx3 [Anabaena sp. CS-542/02]MDB9446721.1 CRISPR-associated protein Csx3 [Anabaena sp. CS-542/02]